MLIPDFQNSNPQICPQCNGRQTIPIVHNQFKVNSKNYWMHLCTPCDLWFSPIDDFKDVDNDHYFDQFEGNEKSRFQQAQSRLEQVSNLVNLSNSRILEIGCAYGDLLKAIQDRYDSSSVVGFEASSKLQKLNQMNGLDCTFDSNKIADHSIDTFIANHVLEHFQQLDEFFDFILRKGKKAHKVFISMPNRNNFWIVKGYIPDLHLPFHRFYYTANQVKNIFEAHSYRIVSLSTSEAGRAKSNLTQSFYNFYRKDLETFKIEYPKRLVEIESIEESSWTVIEKQIEDSGLGSETILLAESKT